MFTSGQIDVLSVLSIVFAFVFLFSTVYYWFRFRIADQERRTLSYQIVSSEVADNALVMSALEREVGNELMRRNAPTYLSNFTLLHASWLGILQRTETEKLEVLNEITNRYPKFSDFNVLGNWSHVLYADGFSMYSDDDLWSLYEDMRLFNALKCELNPHWRNHGNTLSDTELHRVQTYCRQLEDTKLLGHLHRARQQYIMLKQLGIEEKEEDGFKIETPDYIFKPVSHFAERRTGVYIKALDKYGMWGLFSDEKMFLSYYGANENFEERTLDTLTCAISLESKAYDTIQRLS
ncbi:MAG: hypothetical protein KGN33_15440 [Paracoccaceae bacterium]|nr:hypothetical protein [Paracoccaceae bacterium]